MNKKNKREGFINVARHFRSIFIRKFIIKKRNCESRRRICKSWLWVFNLKKALIPPHHLTNFEVEEYYENQPRFNGVNSRDNLPNMTMNISKYTEYFDEYTNIGTHWVALYVKNNEIICFDSFGVEHVPKEIMHFMEHKNIKTNIFRIQADN